MALVQYIKNYKMMCNISKNHGKLCGLVEKNETDYLIYKQICELAPNLFQVKIGLILKLTLMKMETWWKTLLKKCKLNF